MDCDQKIANAIVGSVFATFAFCGCVIGLAFLIRWLIARKRRSTDARQKISRAASVESGLRNEVFEEDACDNNLIMMMAVNENGKKKKMFHTEKHKIASDKKCCTSACSTSRFDTLASKKSLALDDSSITRSPDYTEVHLASRDIIGLGFNITGNMRDGIIVSHVQDKGPAKDSGKISNGDRIMSVTISFESMVYEDALTILSYASPYPVILRLAKDSAKTLTAKRKDSEVHHPMYRSQSLDDINNKQQQTNNKAILVHQKSGIHIDVGIGESIEPTASQGNNSTTFTERGNAEADNMKEILEEKATKEGCEHQQQTEEELDNTHRKAPAHLPSAIRDIVESRKKAKEALDIVEANSSLVTPASMASSEGTEERTIQPTITTGAREALYNLLDGSFDVGVRITGDQSIATEIKDQPSNNNSTDIIHNSNNNNNNGDYDDSKTNDVCICEDSEMYEVTSNVEACCNGELLENPEQSDDNHASMSTMNSLHHSVEGANNQYDCDHHHPAPEKPDIIDSISAFNGFDVRSFSGTASELEAGITKWSEFKALSRSQLDEARMRFFFELMQTSEIFHEKPPLIFTFSSESLANRSMENLSMPYAACELQQTLSINNTYRVTAVNGQGSHPFFVSSQGHLLPKGNHLGQVPLVPPPKPVRNFPADSPLAKTNAKR